MKKNKTSKKIQLNKETITNLQMKELKGGGILSNLGLCTTGGNICKNKGLETIGLCTEINCCPCDDML